MIYKVKLFLYISEMETLRIIHILTIIAGVIVFLYIIKNRK